MADFYPVLARAVAALPSNTQEARRAIYERARTALLGQLRSVQPPMSDEAIAAESDALTRACERIEQDYAPVAEAPPAPPPPAFTLPPFPPASEAPPPPASAEPPAAEPPPFEREPLQPPASETAAPEAVQLRPRIAMPAMPEPAADNRRTLIVGGGVGLAILGIAIAAYVVNSPERQAPPARNGAPTIEANGSAADKSGGKMSERVGGETPPGAATPAVRPDIPVAQRAVLYVEQPDDPQKPRTSGGRAAWRLDSESAGQGQPVETVVRATVEIPEAGLNLVFTIRRNTDKALPASHILGLQFSRTSDDGNGAVKEAGVPQFKSDEGERGAPLSAITSSLGDNLFVAALSNVQLEIDRNVELMTRRNWIDIPVRFASGKRGIIAFEKGFSGDQTITDAFNRWQ